MNRYTACFAIMFVVGLVGCDEPPVATPGQQRREGVTLLADLKSYSPIDDVRRAMGADNWTVLDKPQPPDTSRPRFDHVSVDTKARYCGQDGVLRLQFINDLLVSTAFTPDNLEECLKQLPNGTAFTETGTDDETRHFWLLRTPGEKPFIGSYDSRLQAEIYAWIRRYS